MVRYVYNQQATRSHDAAHLLQKLDLYGLIKADTRLIQQQEIRGHGHIAEECNSLALPPAHRSNRAAFIEERIVNPQCALDVSEGLLSES